MRKYIPFTITFVAGLLLGGLLSASLLVNPKATTQNNDTIPLNVISSYDDMQAQFSDSVGATLETCQSEQGEVYVVTGNGGYTGINHYFSASGELLGDAAFSDVPDENEEPPVTVNQDSCTTLIEATNQL